MARPERSIFGFHGAAWIAAGAAFLASSAASADLKVCHGRSPNPVGKDVALVTADTVIKTALTEGAPDGPDAPPGMLVTVVGRSGASGDRPDVPDRGWLQVRAPKGVTGWVQASRLAIHAGSAFSTVAQKKMDDLACDLDDDGDPEQVWFAVRETREGRQRAITTYLVVSSSAVRAKAWREAGTVLDVYGPVLASVGFLTVTGDTRPEIALAFNTRQADAGWSHDRLVVLQLRSGDLKRVFEDEVLTNTFQTSGETGYHPSRLKLSRKRIDKETVYGRRTEEFCWDRPRERDYKEDRCLVRRVTTHSWSPQDSEFIQSDDQANLPVYAVVKSSGVGLQPKPRVDAPGVPTLKRGAKVHVQRIVDWTAVGATGVHNRYPLFVQDHNGLSGWIWSDEVEFEDEYLKPFIGGDRAAIEAHHPVKL